MFPSSRAPLLVLAFVAVTLSGCVADDAPVVDDASLADTTIEPQYITEEGRDLKLEMLAEDVIAKPTWQLRERFGIHLYFGPDDRSGTHLNAVVVEETASEWMLATDSRAAAKEHAVWDYPIFGAIQREDLGATFFGYDWDIFSFPMKTGDTWTNVITMPRFESEGVDEWTVTFTATYSATIETTEGVRPGLVIVGVTAEGETLIETDYVPAIGWFGNFKFYDMSTEATDDLMFRAISMGHELGWTGTYYVAESEEKVNVFNYAGLGPEGGDPVVAQPSPRTTFTMSETSDTLYGIMVSFAFAGVHELILIDPNQEQYEYRAVPEGADEAAVVFEMISLESVPGEWTVIMAGAGGAAGGVVQLHEITTSSFDMI